METKRQQQLKSIVNNLTPICKSIWKVTLVNWRLLLVNIIGLVGINFALNVCKESSQKIGNTLPPEYYHFIFMGSLAFCMIFIYQMLKINGVFVISKIKENETRNTRNLR